MIYESNEQLKKEFRKVLIETGDTQESVAEKVGISRQALSSVLRKQHISFDDMDRFLAPLGYGIEFKFVKKVGEE